MNCCLSLTFQFGHISFTARVLAVAGLTEECLLGANILAAHGFSLHLDGSPRLTLAGHTVPLSRGRGDIVPVNSARFGGDVQSTLWLGFSTLMLLIASVCGSARLVLVCKLALAFTFVIAFIVRSWVKWRVCSPTPVVAPRVCPPPPCCSARTFLFYLLSVSCREYASRIRATLIMSLFVYVLHHVDVMLMSCCTHCVHRFAALRPEHAQRACGSFFAAFSLLHASLVSTCLNLSQIRFSGDTPFQVT